MTDSINALVKAKEQGVVDFDALSDSVHSELDSLATQINALEGKVNKVSVETRLEQADLLNKGFMACSDDAMTFGAWFSVEGGCSGNLDVSYNLAWKIINLGKFCKNKNTGGLNLAVLYEIAQPKWVKSEDLENKKDLQKALSNAYTKIRRWVPRKQTGPNAKECIIEERKKLGYEPPPKPTAMKGAPSLAFVKDSIERTFNDYRMNFRVNDGELEDLQAFVDHEMELWFPDRKALPFPVLTDVESGFDWVDTLGQQDLHDLIAYAQEKVNG